MQKFGDKLNSIIKLFTNGEKQKALSEINLLLANNSDNGTTLSFAIFNWLRWLIKLCSDM